MRPILRFVSDSDGATAVEYAVMLGLILLAVVGTVKALGDASNGMWGNNQTELEAHGF